MTNPLPGRCYIPTGGYGALGCQEAICNAGMRGSLTSICVVSSGSCYCHERDRQASIRRTQTGIRGQHAQELIVATDNTSDSNGSAHRHPSLVEATMNILTALVKGTLRLRLVNTNSGLRPFP